MQSAYILNSTIVNSIINSIDNIVFELIKVKEYLEIVHSCTKLPNLEMEPKCLTKSDVQLIPDISRTKNDKRVL